MLDDLLEEGSLLLLFDGFDEVGKSERNDVAQKINDFGARYSSCPIMITSRPPAYNREFNDLADRHVDIVPFSDQQIQQFLRVWNTTLTAYEDQLDEEQRRQAQRKRHPKVVGRLGSLLDENPRIKAMARNPLLLTIIAYLYTDTPSVMPRSRTEFYKKATEELLNNRRRDEEFNQFTISTKERVLRNLAVRFQGQKGQDRRTVT